jgi:hypothetical protein
MKNGIERRRYPRIPVGWPVVLITPQGAINGKTRNISISGALFLFSKMLKAGDEFQIILKPSENHEMSMTCEKIWSDDLILADSVYIAIGARFTKISSRDRKNIATLVEAYQPF